MSRKVSTGDTVLDEALNGGFPAGAAVLLTGGPGTGKTTAAMQFLQTGLDNDDTCVFISTEQSVSDLRAALASFGFELDHPELTVTTVHAQYGESVTNGETDLVMRTLDGGSPIDEGRSVPFTPQYLEQYFSRLAPADRVVLDSASGLAALAENHSQYRRLALDIIRQFKQKFEATSLLTAQDYAQQDDTVSNHGTLPSSLSLQFSVDGVIRVWQDELEGEYHRFLHVTKMRGVDHDQRSFEMTLGGGGIHLKPRERSPPASLSAKGRISTGLLGLDDLLGGGLVVGGIAGYLYSSDVHSHLLLTKLMVGAMNEDRHVVLVPSPNLTYEQVDRYMDALEQLSLEIALDNGSVRILDVASSGTRTSAFLPDSLQLDAVEETKAGDLLNRIQQVQFQVDDPIFVLVSCQSIPMGKDNSLLSEMVSTLTAEARRTEDTILFAGASGLLSDDLRVRLENVSDQMVKHARRRDGMEYLRLQKGLGGAVGSSRVIEYSGDVPYLTVS